MCHLIYELGGDNSFSYTEFAQTLSRLSGTTVGYVNMTPEAHRDALVADGLPEDDADVIVDSDQAIPAVNSKPPATTYPASSTGQPRASPNS